MYFAVLLTSNRSSIRRNNEKGPSLRLWWLKSVQTGWKMSATKRRCDWNSSGSPIFSPGETIGLPMNWAIYAPRVRFDVRAEREECERLFRHQARVLQDRLARRGHTDRTRKHVIPEWEKVYQTELQERRVLHQARVLSWGKEKRYYYERKPSFESQARNFTSLEMKKS